MGTEQDAQVHGSLVKLVILRFRRAAAIGELLERYGADANFSDVLELLQSEIEAPSWYEAVDDQAVGSYSLEGCQVLVVAGNDGAIGTGIADSLNDLLQVLAGVQDFR